MRSLSNFLFKTLFIASLGLLIHACSNKNQEVTQQPQDGPFADSSIWAITKEIIKAPNQADLYFKRAQAFQKITQDSLALEDYYKAISLDSSKAMYYSAVGQLLFEHKDIEGSVKWFKKAIERDPLDPLAHLKFAKMLLFVNDNQKAFEEINTVLREDPYNPEAYFLKGMVYKNLNDTNKSISSFKTALQVNPDYAPASLQLGMIYAVLHQDIAIQYFQNAFQADSTLMVALHGKAMYYQDKKDTLKAIDAYQLILSKDSSYTPAYFNYAWLLMQKDSFQKAEYLLTQAYHYDSNDVELTYNRGLCRELLNNKAAALQDYQRVLTLDPAHPEAHTAIARLKP